MYAIRSYYVTKFFPPSIHPGAFLAIQSLPLPNIEPIPSMAPGREAPSMPPPNRRIARVPERGPAPMRLEDLPGSTSACPEALLRNLPFLLPRITSYNVCYTKLLRSENVVRCVLVNSIQLFYVHII